MNPRSAINDYYDELFTTLEKSPVREVVGVLTARGRGYSHVRNNVRLSQSLEIEPWKHAAGPLFNWPLVLWQQDEGHSRFVLGQPAPLQVLRFAARLNEFGTSGLLIEVIAIDDPDPQLIEEARRLRVPITHNDPQFGTLTLNRRRSQFEVRVPWESTVVPIYVFRDDIDGLEPALDTARALCSEKSSWSNWVLACATEHFLDVVNLSPPWSAITAEEFQSRLTLAGITALPGGEFKFWYDYAGDLTGASGIVVLGTIADGPESAILGSRRDHLGL